MGHPPILALAWSDLAGVNCRVFGVHSRPQQKWISFRPALTRDLRDKAGPTAGLESLIAVSWAIGLQFTPIALGSVASR